MSARRVPRQPPSARSRARVRGGRRGRRRARLRHDAGGRPGSISIGRSASVVGQGDSAARMRTGSGFPSVIRNELDAGHSCVGSACRRRGLAAALGWPAHSDEAVRGLRSARRASRARRGRRPVDLVSRSASSRRRHSLVLFADAARIDVRSLHVTVGLSVLLHGLSAAPLVQRYAGTRRTGAASWGASRRRSAATRPGAPVAASEAVDLGDSVSRVFITGSADGLGRLAAQTLIQDEHKVVVSRVRPRPPDGRAGPDRPERRVRHRGSRRHRRDARRRPLGQRARSGGRGHPQR